MIKTHVPFHLLLLVHWVFSRLAGNLRALHASCFTEIMISYFSRTWYFPRCQRHQNGWFNDHGVGQQTSLTWMPLRHYGLVLSMRRWETPHTIIQINRRPISKQPQLPQHLWYAITLIFSFLKKTLHENWVTTSWNMIILRPVTGNMFAK